MFFWLKRPLFVYSKLIFQECGCPLTSKSNIPFSWNSVYNVLEQRVLACAFIGYMFFKEWACCVLCLFSKSFNDNANTCTNTIELHFGVEAFRPNFLGLRLHGFHLFCCSCCCCCSCSCCLVWYWAWAYCWYQSNDWIHVVSTVCLPFFTVLIAISTRFTFPSRPRSTPQSPWCRSVQCAHSFLRLWCHWQP